MAYRSSRRRNTAPPETNPPPALAKQPKTTIFSSSPSPSHYPKPNQDLIQATKSSFLVKPFQSLNLGSKKTKQHSQTKHVDTRLQGKSMTTSAIFDSSKPNNTHQTKITVLTPNHEKDSVFLHSKRTHKEKPPQKPSSELEKWKLQGLLRNEKKVVEDVKVEKSRKVTVVEKEGDVKERVSVSMGQSGGRRKSLCGSMIDLGDFFAINGAKMVSADMPPFMQIHAVDCARKAFDSMEKFTSKTLALSLKKVLFN